ncbi:DUF5685 family protein [Caproiciproducens faecalis]|uniref:Uncharacterized protein n=1 Tax=Caproiciproducens faecalis TaxID=2820301 RepID=A0ABS7DQ94_9FIRM|nr:hypothetical protein [Caproiciproducens faecalis]
MFGYVRPQKSELLVREYEQYKGVYCSLCRQLGKSYGGLSRLTLSYDCTFYAMLLLSFRPECPGFHSGRCVVNPMKKCTFCSSGEQEFVAASALSVIMTYYKIRDDIVDSRFWGKIRAYAMLLLAARAHRKAAADFPQLDAIVAASVDEQKAAEQAPDSSIDSCAEPTAKMLQQVFESVAGTDTEPDDPKARILRQFGYFLGRWVYLIDAADDMEKDLKTASFNPFVIKFRLDDSSSPEDLDKARNYANQVLNLTLSQLTAALNILDLDHFNEIIQNVVLKGLPDIQKELLFKKEKMHV